MKNATIRRLLTYLKPYRRSVAAALGAALVCVPLTLLGPVLVGGAIDAALGAGRVDFDVIKTQLTLYILCMAGAALAQWVMLVFTRKLSAWVSRDMRMAACERLNQVPLARLDTHPHGDIVSRLVNDSDAVAEGLLQGLGQLFPGAVTIVATFAIMLTLSPLIGFVVVAITPLSILFARFVGRRTAAYFMAQTQAMGAASSLVREMVGNQELVQAFGYGQRAAARYEEEDKRYFETNFKATFYSSVVNPGTRFVNAIVYAAVGCLGALYAISGGITVGGLSAFLSYANQYTKPFNEVSAVLTQLQGAVAGAARLFEVMDWPAQRPDAADAKAPRHSEGNVRAQDVDFSYTADRPLIEGFSLNAASGQRIALVGPTGSGKTTIINLLMRFYEIQAGQIFVDGEEIRNIQRASLRSLFGMVLQDSWLKKATVRENIAYGKPSATEAEIIEAAQSALAYSFIQRLPGGLDTVLDTGGNDLSAGQRQLLCIARIMLAKPDMLILDEATSSIDTRTELLVQKALERLMTGHTSFVVAHRLATVQGADLILVMRDGQIVERGKHEQLLSQDGFYAQLYNSQFAPG